MAYDGIVEKRDQFLERPLPSSAEAERSILGAVLLDNQLLGQAIEHLEPDSFYSPFHRSVFRAMTRLFETKQKIDPILIGEELKKEGKLETSGGVAAVANLTYGLPHFSDILNYAELVKGKSRIRNLIKANNQIQATALAEEESPEQILSFAQNLINEVCTDTRKRGFSKVSDLSLDRMMRAAELQQLGVAFTGIRTGFDDLDEITGGLQKTDLIIVAGRPGMGKSSFVGNVAENACQLEPEAVVPVFSLEMSDEQYTDRLLCSSAEVDLNRFRRGILSRQEFERLSEAQGRFSDYKLFIDDTSALSPLEMRSKLMRLRAEQKRLDLVIVDYLQRMVSSKRTESRQQEVSHIARELKSIAKDFNVPVVAVSSLSRECEKRNPPRPKMSDLRESGDIESEADIVAFIYRDEYYKQTEENYNVAELIIDKNRHGATQTLQLSFIKEITKFGNLYR